MTNFQMHTDEPALANAAPLKLWVVADEDFQVQVEKALQSGGFDTETVGNPQQLLQPPSATDAAGLVLAQTANGLQLFDVLRDFRRVSNLPVFLLLEAGNETDALIGLELGADDYLLQPVNERVFVSRMRALLRRSRQAGNNHLPAPVLKCADITLDVMMRSAWLGQEKLQLTSVELSLLQFLMEAQGTPLSREELVQRVLGRAAQPTDRSLDVHVSNLRKKLGRTDYIKGLRGIGYLFLAPAENSVSQ